MNKRLMGVMAVNIALACAAGWKTWNRIAIAVNAIAILAGVIVCLIRIKAQ